MNEYELLEMLAEEYAFENNFNELLTENFVDEIREEYEHLKARNPKVAGMVKGLVYTTTGPLGGAVYGLNKRRNMRIGKIPKEECVVLRKTLKGLGYPLLASIVTPAGAVAIGAWREMNKADAKKQEQKQNKNLKEDYELFEEELLEAVDILVEEYGFDEEDAIEAIMEAYEEDLEVLEEGVLNRSKIPASITYHRYINAHNKVNEHKNNGNEDKYKKAVKKADKLEGRLRKQVGEYNDYQNRRYIKYASKGKRPKRYNQIYLK